MSTITAEQKQRLTLRRLLEDERAHDAASRIAAATAIDSILIAWMEEMMAMRDDTLSSISFDDTEEVFRMELEGCTPLIEEDKTLRGLLIKCALNDPESAEDEESDAAEVTQGGSS